MSAPIPRPPPFESMAADDAPQIPQVGDQSPPAARNGTIKRNNETFHANKSIRRNTYVANSLAMMCKSGFTQKPKMTRIQRLYQLMRLPNFSEFFVSVDHHTIWRRHLAWSLKDGDNLRAVITARFASNLVFMSLLLGTEIGVLFSPSKPADAFRAAMKKGDYSDVNFWAAIVLCVSIGTTLSSLVANFTAWAIVGSVSPQNAHAIIRSSVGLQATQLPARLVITSIYLFAGWLMMFMGILLPDIWAFAIALIPVVLIGYIVGLYSILGRLIIYSKGMRHREIFNEDVHNTMTPRRLSEELAKKAQSQKARKTPLPLYYRGKTELSRQLTDLRNNAQQSSNIDCGDSLHFDEYVDQILSQSMHRNAAVDIETDLEEGRNADDDDLGDLLPSEHHHTRRGRSRSREESGRKLFETSQNSQSSAIAINMG